jgi:hypothetical protein
LNEAAGIAADAVYGNSIDFELEVIAKKGVVRKALLLMFSNILLQAFTPMMVRSSSSFFKRRYACPRLPYTRQRPPRQRLRSNHLYTSNRGGANRTEADLREASLSGAQLP